MAVYAAKIVWLIDVTAVAVIIIVVKASGVNSYAWIIFLKAIALFIVLLSDLQLCLWSEDRIAETRGKSALYQIGGVLVILVHEVLLTLHNHWRIPLIYVILITGGVVFSPLVRLTALTSYMIIIIICIINLLLVIRLQGGLVRNKEVRLTLRLALTFLFLTVTVYIDVAVDIT